MIPNPIRLVIATLAFFAVALATGAAFAGWLNHSAEIFLTYTTAGLAWCL